MFKHLRHLMLLAAALLLFNSCGSEGDEAAGASGKSSKSTMKLASVLPADHPTSRALEFFAKRLSELSAGTLEVKVFPNSQLGNANESVENTQSGDVELVFVSTAPLSSFAPEFNALGMPFIFRDKSHEFAVVDGPIGERLNKSLDPIGLKALCYFDAGSRNIMTKKGPVTQPADLSGMKIRVMPSKLMTDTVNALGASAIAMGQAEVYGALQTGVLDGWENNPATALSFKMYETGCNQFAWTRHLSVPDMLLINKSYYDGLTPEQRGFVDAAAKETLVFQRQAWREDEQKAIDQLKAAGMIFTDVDQAPFVARVEPLYEQKYQELGPDFKKLCEDIRNLK